jgi:hypothetical protein
MEQILRISFLAIQPIQIIAGISSISVNQYKNIEREKNN